MKECRKCKNTLPLNSFSKYKRSPDGLQLRCKSCCKEDYRRYRDRYKSIDRSEYFTEYRKENRELIRERNRKWQSENKETVLKKEHRRRKKLKDATPAWLSDYDKQEIRNYYIARNVMRVASGENYTVDHVIPFCGDNVSGLHVPWNLQIITNIENILKGTSVETRSNAGG